jgi:membrane-associated phospholipid phosphatase
MLAVCIAAVLLCMALVDRPVADFVHTHLRQAALDIWTTRAIELLSIVLILTLVVLFAAGFCLMAGRSIPAWADIPLLMSWSGVWALSSAIVLKRLIGRSVAYPTYVLQHVYAFHPLQGVPDFDAFPSGTTSVSAALLAVLWIRVPRLRAVWVGVLGLIAVALVITNSHWVSDVIGGACLGASIGWMTVVLRRAER